MIGAARYFAPRYWARRYWPKLGAAAVAADAIGELTTDDGPSRFLDGTAAFDTHGGSLAGGTLGGSLSHDTLGGSLS